MSLCELYKDTHITIRSSTGNIYYGPIKKIYQTFYDKILEIFYNGKWYSVKIVGIPSEKRMFKINNDFVCSADLLLKSGETDISVGDLSIGDIVDGNTHQIKNIKSTSGKIKITSIRELDVTSEWLFGIEFWSPINIPNDEKENHNKYLTLTNGIIIRGIK